MRMDLTVTGLTGVPSVAMRVKSWPSMENWTPHTVHRPPTRRSLYFTSLFTHTSLYGTGVPVCWPDASCKVITECWWRLQRSRHGNSWKTQWGGEYSGGLITFVPEVDCFWLKIAMFSLTPHKLILECCLNTHRSTLLSYPLQSVIIILNNTATCRNSPSARCVSAAYHVRKNLDISRKTFTSLKQILRWFVAFLYKLLCMFFGV